MGVRVRQARVLLTGASGGLGEVFARRLAAEGADLLISGRREDRLRALAAELGARWCIADLSCGEGVDALLAEAGSVDVLVANAALPASGRLAGFSAEEITRALEVNLHAPIALARALAPGMVARERGQLVFVGSLSSRAASAGSSLYNATKFGLRGFALALRGELAPDGVGVSLLLPGFVRDAGMFADTGIRLPRGMGTSSPGSVAAALIDAIERNRGEVVVAPPAMRLGSQVASLAPGLAIRLGGRSARRLAERFEEAQANKR